MHAGTFGNVQSDVVGVCYAVPACAEVETPERSQRHGAVRCLDRDHNPRYRDWGIRDVGLVAAPQCVLVVGARSILIACDRKVA